MSYQFYMNSIYIKPFLLPSITIFYLNISDIPLASSPRPLALANTKPRLTQNNLNIKISLRVHGHLWYISEMEGKERRGEESKGEGDYILKFLILYIWVIFFSLCYSPLISLYPNIVLWSETEKSSATKLPMYYSSSWKFAIFVCRRPRTNWMDCLNTSSCWK